MFVIVCEGWCLVMLFLVFNLIFDGLLYSQNFSRCYLEQQLIFWWLPLLLVEENDHNSNFVFILNETFPIPGLSINRNFVLLSIMTKTRKCILGTHSNTKVIISNYFVVRKRFDTKTLFMCEYHAASRKRNTISDNSFSISYMEK